MSATSPQAGLVAVVRAENAPGAIAARDRRYGVLAAGTQGSGKSSALLRLFANDLADPNAAQIVIDPKSELVKRCLEVTPPDCGKEVWYLDLGDPRFGMTPLRLHGARADFGIEAAAVAEGVVAALLTINEGQIFQSSRRYLYHAVIGALAIAELHPRLRHAMFEHVHGLLLPKGAGEGLRQAAATACTRLGVAQTAFFYSKELPGDIAMAGRDIAMRLDAPRNKIEGIVGVPPLKAFFQHPFDISMRDLVQRRAILLVDANMARIGEDNAQACMHFLFQMLHRQMQSHMQIPEGERPRVALICDEAHYLLSRNVVRQIATHRAAGLDVAMGIQYLAQLGAGAESASVTEEIRKGVTNLLQSRFLFRLSDPRDAEEVSRIAMTLATNLSHHDPDSRALRRVSPEVMLNIENHFCVCSWIAGGARIPSFIGRTYPIPDVAPVWAQAHLAQMHDRVGESPAGFVQSTAELTDIEQLHRALRTDADPPEEPSIPNGDAVVTVGGRTDSAKLVKRRARCGSEDNASSSPLARSDAGEGDVSEETASGSIPIQTLVRTVGNDRQPERSPALRVFGRPVTTQTQLFTEQPRVAPASIRELAVIDRLSSIGRWDESPPPAAPLRLFDADLAILKFLDRGGVVLAPILARACLADRADRTVRDRLSKLQTAGLIARAEIGVLNRSPGEGHLPTALRLTAHGFRVLREKGLVDPERQWRVPEVGERGLSVPHDQHVLAWITQLSGLLGERIVTDNWRTPRMRHGIFGVPQIGEGRSRHVLLPAELSPPGSAYAYDGACTLQGPDARFADLKPDATIEIRIPSMKLTFDVMLEVTLAAKPSHNRPKFSAYDAFLLGWYQHHRRYQHLHGRPVVLFAFQTEDAMRDGARIADQTLDGRVGAIGVPQHEWSFPAREHVFFCLEEDVHYGSMRCHHLPRRPAALRSELGEHAELLYEVSMLPPPMMQARR